MLFHIRAKPRQKNSHPPGLSFPVRFRKVKPTEAENPDLYTEIKETGSPEADRTKRKKTTALQPNRPPKRDLPERSEQRHNQRSSQTDQIKRKAAVNVEITGQRVSRGLFFLSSQEMRVPPFPHRSARAPLPPSL